MFHLRTGSTNSEVLLHTIDEIQIKHQSRPVFYTSPLTAIFPEDWVHREFSGSSNQLDYDSIWLLDDSVGSLNYQQIKPLCPHFYDRNITLYWVRQTFNDDILKVKLDVINHAHYIHFKTIRMKNLQLVKSLRYFSTSKKAINLSRLSDVVYVSDFNDDIILNTYADLSGLNIWWDVANAVKW